MPVKKAAATPRDVSTVYLPQTTDTLIVATGPRSITLVPSFQQGYVPNIVDGFRFTMNVTDVSQMTSKIFRYRLIPTKIQASVTDPPTAIELKGFFDGVCSPSDIEDFPEDWPTQNAKPPWYRLDYVDLIFRSRSIANEAYSAIVYEVQRLVDTLNLMDQLDAKPPITISGPQ